MALEAQIDRSYVGRIERGIENVTVSTLRGMAVVLAAFPLVHCSPNLPTRQNQPAKSRQKPKRS
ncbi:transcriptional regulator [Brucella intermedia]|uniref:transcriptional regulator n=1 Tax=Brucella intermedia TaxID=94625 RepID=UPI0035E40CB1